MFCVCACTFLRLLITTHMNYSLNNRLKKLYCFLVIASQCCSVVILQVYLYQLTKSYIPGNDYLWGCMDFVYTASGIDLF